MLPGLVESQLTAALEQWRFIAINHPATVNRHHPGTAVCFQRRVAVEPLNPGAIGLLQPRFPHRYMLVQMYAISVLAPWALMMQGNSGVKSEGPSQVPAWTSPLTCRREI